MHERLRIVGLGACLVLLVCWAAAFAAAATNPGEEAALERVKSFDSTVMVMPDGDMVVRETIAVHAEGIEIKHGIYRQFPTSVRNDEDIPVYPGFQLLEVKVNGEEAPYFMAEDDDVMAVYIGRDDTFLAPGDYTYTLSYRLEDQTGRQGEYNALSWCVNGDWTLPIDLLTGCIRIAGATAGDIREVAAWIEHKPDDAVRTFVRADGVVEVDVQRALCPGESLDISVLWQPQADLKIYPKVTFKDAGPEDGDK